MEYNPTLPIYLQTANAIKRDIVTGSFPRERSFHLYVTWRWNILSTLTQSVECIKNWKARVYALPDEAWEPLLQKIQRR